jgi:hypothetical protein
MSYDMVEEDVPPFQNRVGDHVIHGSNNSCLILGRDRAKKGPATIKDGLGTIDDSGKGKGTGVAHLIAGRMDKKGDPDFDKDSSFLYLSMKTNPDENLGITSVEKEQKKLPAAVVKSDAVRLVFRKDIKICVSDGKNYLFMDGDKVTVKIGDKSSIEMDKSTCKVFIDKTKITLDGSEVKIDSPKVHLTGGCQKPWEKLFDSIIKAVEQHDHMTAVGPSSPAIGGPGTGSPDSQMLSNFAQWQADVEN